MKVNWEQVEQNIKDIPPAPTFAVSALLTTWTVVSNRMSIRDHAAHKRQMDAIRTIIRMWGIRQQVEASLLTLARECYQAGIYAASGSHYEPANPEVARLLEQVRARLARTATPEQPVGEPLYAAKS